MITLDFITALFYEIDEQIGAIPTHPEAHLWPSEVVTLGRLNSAEGSPLSTGLQNRACQFPSTRLLSDIALGMSTLFRGSVPMYLIMADEV